MILESNTSGRIASSADRDETRVRLTVQENSEAIKRYRHIKPANSWRVKLCSERCPGTAHTCTCEKGHRGPHVAHSLFRRVTAVWDSGTGARARGHVVDRASEATTPSGLRAWNPVGLPTRSTGGVLEALRGLVARTVSSADELAFILLFCVFVWFALEVLLILY